MALDTVARHDLIWLIVAAFALMAAAAARLAPTPQGVQPYSRPSQVSRRAGLAGFLVITAAASLVQASHAVYYGFSTLDWSARGLDGIAIGALWALGVVGEIVLLAISARLPGGLGPLALVGLGAAGGTLRWSIMALDPPFALLPVLQLLHGLSFGATHLGSVQFLVRTVPQRRAASAQGDFSTVLSVVMAAATGLSGSLYGAFGGHAYAAMALLAAAGGVCALLGGRFASTS